MTIATSSSTVSYAGSGVQTAFPVPFQFETSAHLSVYLVDDALGTEILQTIGTHYTVTGGNFATGTVTMVTAPATGFTLRIDRNAAQDQTVDLETQGPFFPSAIEAGLDRLSLQIQDLARNTPSLAEFDAQIAAAFATQVAIMPQSWNFVGDGVTTSFGLAGQQAEHDEMYVVAISGVLQKAVTDYDITTGAINFTSAPPIGCDIVVRCFGYAATYSLGDATQVRSSGSTIYRSLASRFADSINVLDYGADPTGVTDSSAAILAAAAVADAANKILVFPPGDYVIGAQLAMSATKRLRWVGSGAGITRLLATAALAGQSIIKWTAVRDSSIEDMTINGAPAAPAGAAVEFYQDNIADISTRNLLVRVRLGEDTGSAPFGINYGIRFSAWSIAGKNNDQHILRDSKISAFNTAGVSIEHDSSLLNRLENMEISYGPVGVRCIAGSFHAHWVFQHTISSIEYQVGDGVSGGTFGTHPIVIEDSAGESNATSAAYPKILQTGTEAGIEVIIDKFSKYGSTPTLTIIDFQSDGGRLYITGSRLALGQTGQTLSATSATSTVSLIGNPALGLTAISVAGNYVSFGNTWLSATGPTETIDQTKEFLVAGQVTSGADKVGRIRSRTLSLSRVAGEEARQLTGVVTIADAATTATVTLPVAQTTALYNVIASATLASGAPASDAYVVRIFNKTTTSFDVGLKVAPGAGTSVSINWLLIR